MSAAGRRLRPLRLGLARVLGRSILASRPQPASRPSAVRPAAGDALLRAGCEALFDRDYYLGCHPDVAAAGVEPLAHYVNHGEAEGRNPHPLFNTVYYRMQMGAGEGSPGPLVHFALSDAARAFDPHPAFDLRHYASQAGPLPTAGRYLLHYLESGWRHGLTPHPAFDATWSGGRPDREAGGGIAPLLDLVSSPDDGRGIGLTHRLATMRAASSTGAGRRPAPQG